MTKSTYLEGRPQNKVGHGGQIRGQGARSRRNGRKYSGVGLDGYLLTTTGRGERARRANISRRRGEGCQLRGGAAELTRWGPAHGARSRGAGRALGMVSRKGVVYEAAQGVAGGFVRAGSRWAGSGRAGVPTSQRGAVVASCEQVAGGQACLLVQGEWWRRRVYMCAAAAAAAAADARGCH